MPKLLVTLLAILVSVDAQNTETCQRFAYHDKCANGRRSQFTIRWYAKDNVCTSYAFGYCVQDANSSLTIRTKSDCELSCLKTKKPQLQAIIHQPVAVHQQPSLNIRSFLTLSSSRLKHNLTSNFTDKYICERGAYRRWCPSGALSKFSFRWFFDGAFCSAYPYGVCHEDEQFAPFPKTKEICMQFCYSDKSTAFPTPGPFPTDSPSTTKVVLVYFVNASSASTATTAARKNASSKTSKSQQLLFDDDPFIGFAKRNLSHKSALDRLHKSSFDFEKGYVRQSSTVNVERRTTSSRNIISLSNRSSPTMSSVNHRRN